MKGNFSVQIEEITRMVQMCIRDRYNAAEFYKLGLGDPYCISALSGSGTGELLDLVVGKFSKRCV